MLSRGQAADNPFQIRQKPHVEHAVGLVQDERVDVIEADLVLPHVVQQAARRGDENFDARPHSRLGFFVSGRAIRRTARDLIARYRVKTPSTQTPIRDLSGGNVQRAVLARELSDEADVLIVANPVFGLDFAAVAEIHQRLMDVRNAGGAVLLVSEDLDELLALSDRIAVMSEGRIVHEVDARAADRRTLGAFMGGHAH